MVDIITGFAICHINIFCHHKRHKSYNINQDNVIVCKYLQEVGDAPLPDYCKIQYNIKPPRHRNEY